MVATSLHGHMWLNRCVMAGPTPAAWMHGTIAMLRCAKVGVIAAHLELDVKIFARPAAGGKKLRLDQGYKSRSRPRR